MVAPIGPQADLKVRLYVFAGPVKGACTPKRPREGVVK
jgi:hypothetical protein